MQKKNMNIQTPECPQYCIPLTKELSDIMHQKTDERYSRFEAFRTLLELQAQEMAGRNLQENEPFVIAISTLASQWKWHRHTVTGFLDELVQHDVLTKETIYNGYRICLRNLTVVS